MHPLISICILLYYNYKYMGPFYFLFIGGFVGFFIGGIIANIIVDKYSNYRLLGIIVSYSLTLALVIYIFSINAGFFSLGIIISVGGFTIYVIRTNKKQQTTRKKESPYLNHCWNCKTPIDSRVDIKCPKCRKFYICPNCGKCYCDSDEYKNKYGGY